MQLKFYNTLSHSVQDFKPIDPTNVKIYSCGVTVYSEVHLGNMRKYFIDDLLKNVVKYVGGYPTTHVVNITDVGHLTGENEGDADHGEDKMEKGARREGITARDVAKKYTQVFDDNCRMLLLDPFDIMPHATDHIQEQVDMIKALEQKGYTYSIEGDGVYFDTSKMEDYGVLVGKKHLEGLQSGSRIQDAGKRNITDFALWKFNISGKKRDMERDSPWGIGFPGRHIECSAMSIKYLGRHFDIHTGGIEHIPVHHTNEIAQSESSIAESPRVNYWIHYQFLNIDGQKIAKSVGNIITIPQVLEKGYSAYDLRYFYLQTQYRSSQDFSREGLEAAKRSRASLKKKIQEGLISGHEQEEKAKEFLANDLNTASLLAHIHSYGISKEIDDNILKLGLFEIEEEKSIEIPYDIQTLADQRRQAKLDKDWALADELRNKLNSLGRNMKDEKEGYQLVIHS